MDFLTRRCGRRQQDVVQQCVGIGATAEEDTDNGRGTLGIAVDQVCLHISQAPVDGVLRRRVEVVLRGAGWTAA